MPLGAVIGKGTARAGSTRFHRNTQICYFLEQIERRRVTSRYHGSNFSRSQQWGA